MKNSENNDEIVISLDLGDVIFNNQAPPIGFRGLLVRQLHDGAKEIIKELVQKGFKVIIISRIDPGDECRVSMNLFYHEIVPHLIKPKDVHFCYNRNDKGSIAKAKNVSWHVDDRVEVLESIYESGIPNMILFTGSNNESERLIRRPNVFVVSKWDDVILTILCPGMRIRIT